MNRGISYRHQLWLWLCVALLLSCPSAQAQQPTDAEQQAQEKFQQGMTQMRERSFEKACQLFEQSLALAKDITTQFRLGECYEMLGRTASAWRMFNEVATLAEIAELRAKRTLAAEKAAAIKAGLMQLKLRLSSEAKGIAGLTVTLDGQPFPESSLEESWPIDPGNHRLVASAPGYRAWQKQIRMWKEGTTQEIVVPALEPAPPGSELEESEESAETGEGQPDATPPDGEGSVLGPVGISLGSAGVAALIVGLGVGLAGKSKFDDAVASSCDEARGVCNQEGLDEQDSALIMGDVGTVLFVIGGVAAAAGLVLWLVAPSGSGDEPADTASLGLRVKPGALTLTGAF